MTVYLFANAVASQICGSPITSSQTTVTLPSTANFPVPSAGQQFSVLIEDKGSGTFDPNNPLVSNFEYQPVTNNNTGTNTLTFGGGVRGSYAGTSPKTYSTGAQVSAVLLKEDLLAAFARIDQANTALFTAAGLVSTAGLTLGGHDVISAYTPAPTLGSLQTGIASQAFAGAPYAGSTDSRGVLSLTTSGSPPTAGSPVAVVTFGTAYANTPLVIPAGQNSALHLFEIATVTVNGFTLYAAANLNASSSYTVGWRAFG